MLEREERLLVSELPQGRQLEGYLDGKFGDSGLAFVDAGLMSERNLTNWIDRRPLE